MEKTVHFYSNFFLKNLGLCWVSCLPLATETQPKATEVTGWDYKVKRNLSKMNKDLVLSSTGLSHQSLYGNDQDMTVSVAEIISKSLFFFNFYFCIRAQLIGNVVWEFQIYSKMLQLYIYMYLVFSKSFSQQLLQNNEQSSLCYTVILLVINFKYSSVYRLIKTPNHLSFPSPLLPQ